MKNLTTLTIIISTWMLTSMTSTAQITSYPYTLSFESTETIDWTTIGDVQDCTDDWDIVSLSSMTVTGPAATFDGSDFLATIYEDCGMVEKVVTSPSFDLVSLVNPGFSFYYHMYGADMGIVNLEVSTDGGANWDATPLWSETGQVQSSNTADWNQVSIPLSQFSGQTISLRFRANNDGPLSQFSLDLFELTDLGLCDVSYAYDAAGNRTSRTYCVASMAQAEQQQFAAARSTEEGSKIVFSDEQLFKVFPNPASHYIQIESMESVGPTTVHLLDASGRELYISNISDQESIQVDMSSYTSGVYVLWIQMEDEVVTKKIIKQ